MSSISKIEWTDATWNPVTGCDKVSPGCKNCYAKREWVRLSANPKTVYFGRRFEDVREHSDRLEEPLRWTKPRRIFVDSMGDLFHDDVDDEFIDRVFAVMAMTPRHTYQVLTKRAKRMQEYLAAGGRAAEVFRIVREDELGYWAGKQDMPPLSWPLPNAWIGVSVEDQARADERIPRLLQAPAAVRFISAEPVLGPVDVWKYLRRATVYEVGSGRELRKDPALDWVVAGGESGPCARPAHPDWFRSLRDQCAGAGVPFHFKQWGAWTPYCAPSGAKQIDLKGAILRRVGKKIAGRHLDGCLHDGAPA